MRSFFFSRPVVGISCSCDLVDFVGIIARHIARFGIACRIAHLSLLGALFDCFDGPGEVDDRDDEETVAKKD